MKRIVFSLLALTALVFVGCENDGGGKSSKFEDEWAFVADQIIGTWATTQGFVGGEWLDIPSDSDMYATMTFYENGDYYGDSELFGSGMGTYTLSGNILKTYFNGKLFYVYTIKSLTDTSAEVTMAYQNANIGLRLKKIDE